MALRRIARGEEQATLRRQKSIILPEDLNLVSETEEDARTESSDVHEDDYMETDGYAKSLSKQSLGLTAPGSPTKSPLSKLGRSSVTAPASSAPSSVLGDSDSALQPQPDAKADGAEKSTLGKELKQVNDPDLVVMMRNRLHSRNERESAEAGAASGAKNKSPDSSPRHSAAVDEEDDDQFVPSREIGKTASFRTAQQFAKDLAAAPPNLPAVGLTSYLMKIRKNKLYRRKFTLLGDETALRWDSMKKRGTHSKILMSYALNLVIGQTTDTFKTLPNAASFKDLSFSLFYLEKTGTEVATKSLDLIAPEKATFDIWTKALAGVVSRSCQILGQMKRGAIMTKCRPKNKYERKYFLTDDFQIKWEPSKTNASLDLAKVKFIREGQQTAAFRKAHNVKQFKSHSFSLVYGKTFETLDLICHNAADFTIWVAGLKRIISGATDSQNIMQQGIKALKVYPKSGKEAERVVTLSPEMDFISWQPGKPGKKHIAITEIKELRRGMKTETFKARLGDEKFNEAQCLSIVYGDKWNTLDLFFPDPNDYDDWVTGLEDLLFSVHEVARHVAKVSDKRLEDLFQSEANKKGLVTRSKAAKLLFTADPTLQTPGNQKRISDFVRHSTERSSKLTLVEFQQLYRQLLWRPELNDAMQPYGNYVFDTCSYTFTAKQLRQFLLKEQHYSDEAASIDNCRMLIAEHERNDERIASLPMAEAVMTVRGFASLLLSEQGDAFNPTHLQIYQDMTLPMTNYFVSSSHNTYLTSDQLKGPSSTEQYAKVLLLGNRCLEIDCWDGPNDEPVVYHGHTLTSKILFKDVITVINEYAFKESPYPLVLSLENHCSLKQQQAMAKYMINTFGEKLLTERTTQDKQPAPGSLKHKILVKCQKPYGKAKMKAQKIVVAYADDGSRDNGEDTGPTTILDELDESDDDEEGPGELSLVAKSTEKWKRDDVTEAESLEDGKINLIKRAKLKRGSTKEFKVSKKGIIKMHSDLANLVLYCASMPRFYGFDFQYKYYKYWFYTSFGENRAFSIYQDESAALELAKFTKSYIGRTYPAGSRVDSSNFHAQPLWNMGIQMAALNFQTEGPQMQMYLGKFRQNGNCGYILKPPYMRNKEIQFDPNMYPGTTIVGEAQQTIVLNVISAQDLPRCKSISPYVTVEIVGIPADSMTNKTATLHGEGLAPLWNETFAFCLTAPSLALVRFCVYDNTGNVFSKVGWKDPSVFLGEATMPYDSLREGFRHITLYSYAGEPLSATLFVHTMKQSGHVSEQWLGHLSKPPVYTDAPPRMPKFVRVNHKPVDHLASDFEKLQSKVFALRQKVLILKDQYEIAATYSKSGDNVNRHDKITTRHVARTVFTRHSRQMETARRMATSFGGYLKVLKTRVEDLLAKIDEIAESDPIATLLKADAPPSSKDSNERRRLAFGYNRNIVNNVKLTIDSTIDLLARAFDKRHSQLLLFTHRKSQEVMALEVSAEFQ